MRAVLSRALFASLWASACLTSAPKPRGPELEWELAASKDEQGLFTVDAWVDGARVRAVVDPFAVRSTLSERCFERRPPARELARVRASAGRWVEVSVFRIGDLRLSSRRFSDVPVVLDKATSPECLLVLGADFWGSQWLAWNPSPPRWRGGGEASVLDSQPNGLRLEDGLDEQGPRWPVRMRQGDAEATGLFRPALTRLSGIGADKRRALGLRLGAELGPRCDALADQIPLSRFEGATGHTWALSSLPTVEMPGEGDGILGADALQSGSYRIQIRDGAWWVHLGTAAAAAAAHPCLPQAGSPKAVSAPEPADP